MSKEFPESEGFKKRNDCWSKRVHKGRLIITERLLDPGKYSLSFVTTDQDETFLVWKGTEKECVDELKTFVREDKINKLLDLE
jgi:hypothetical protein